MQSPVSFQKGVTSPLSKDTPVIIADKRTQCQLHFSERNKDFFQFSPFSLHLVATLLFSTISAKKTPYIINKKSAKSLRYSPVFGIITDVDFFDFFIICRLLRCAGEGALKVCAHALFDRHRASKEVNS